MNGNNRVTFRRSLTGVVGLCSVVVLSLWYDRRQISHQVDEPMVGLIEDLVRGGWTDVKHHHDQA